MHGIIELCLQVAKVRNALHATKLQTKQHFSLERIVNVDEDIGGNIFLTIIPIMCPNTIRTILYVYNHKNNVEQVNPNEGEGPVE